MPKFSKSLRIISGLLAWGTGGVVFIPLGRNFNPIGKGPEEFLDGLIFLAIYGVYYFILATWFATD